MLHVFHSDGETRDTLRIFDRAVIFTAAIYRVHAPIETDGLEADLVDEKEHRTPALEKVYADKEEQ